MWLVASLLVSMGIRKSHQCVKLSISKVFILFCLLKYRGLLWILGALKDIGIHEPTGNFLVGYILSQAGKNKSLEKQYFSYFSLYLEGFPLQSEVHIPFSGLRVHLIPALLSFLRISPFSPFLDTVLA